jgi:RNA polymerase sigma-70 factor, ECF subfamily
LRSRSDRHIGSSDAAEWIDWEDALTASDTAPGPISFNGRRVDEETRQWLVNLDPSSPTRDEALIRLHGLLLRVAGAELARRRDRQPITGPELDDVAHQAADDALVAITAKLPQFRGDSRFTTWAYKFAVLEVSSKLARHFWQNPSVALGSEDWERLPDRFGLDPGDHAERAELIRAFRQAVNEVLTPHQREAFVAIFVDGVPLEALALKINSNRNAIYKTVFDARRRLRAALAADGFLSSFETESPADEAKTR